MLMVALISFSPLIRHKLSFLVGMYLLPIQGVCWGRKERDIVMMSHVHLVPRLVVAHPGGVRAS